MVAGAVTVAAYVAVPGGGEEEVAQQVATGTPSSDTKPTSAPSESLAATAAAQKLCDPKTTPPPGVTVWRWGDYTIEVPKDSGVDVSRQFWRDGSPAFWVLPSGKPEYSTIIDAADGNVLDQSGPVDYQLEDEVRSVISSAAICPLDNSNAVWPYKEGLPPSERTGAGKVAVVVPEPAAGIEVSVVVGLCVTGVPCGPVIPVKTTTSTLNIDAGTGTVQAYGTSIDANDSEAFDRYVAAIQHMAAE
jgi:hypothetical protein